MTDEHENNESIAEKAIRAFSDKHGPSGPAWNISAVLDVIRTAQLDSGGTPPPPPPPGP